MCQWNTLYAGPTGYALQCKDCRYVQLAFGTTVLTLSARDFSEFAVLVRQRAERPLVSGDDRKCVLMPTPFPWCQVLLTGQELADLHRLLEQADNEMTAASMLLLFQRGSGQGPEV